MRLMKRITGKSELSACAERIKAQRDPHRTMISLCGGSGCGAYGTARVKASLEKELSAQGLADEVKVWLYL